MEDKDNFEKHIQDTLENYEPPVGMEQWENIAARLPQEPWRFKWILPYVFSLLLFLGGGLTGYFYSKKPTGKPQNSVVISSDTLYLVKVDTVFVKGENKIIYRNVVKYRDLSSPASQQALAMNQAENSWRDAQNHKSLGKELNKQTASENGILENATTGNSRGNDKVDFRDKTASETGSETKNVFAKNQDSTLENNVEETEEKLALSQEKEEEDTILLKEEEKDSMPASAVDKNSWQFDYGFSALGLFPLRSFYEYKASFVPGVDIAAYKGRAGIRLGLQYLLSRSEIDDPYFISQDIINTLPNYPNGQILDDIKINTNQLLVPLKFSWKIIEEKQNNFFVETGLLGRYAYSQRYIYEFAAPFSTSNLQVRESKKSWDISHYTIGLGTNSSLSKKSSLYLGVEYFLPSSIFQPNKAPVNPIHFHAFSLNIGLRFLIQ